MEFEITLLVLATVFGLFMAWGIGANDVANAMGTSVGSKAVTITQAVIIAAIFEFAGAILAGGEVTDTVRKGIVNPEVFVQAPQLLVFGMLAALLAAAVWLLVASYFGWPVSTTHSIVGAVVGFAAVGIGPEAVHWDKTLSIVASWVVSPLLSGTIAFFLFLSVQRLILDTDTPLANAKRYVPLYMFAVGFVVALVTLTKGLKHVGVEFGLVASALIAAGTGLIVLAAGVAGIRRLDIDPRADLDFHYTNVERVFGVLMIITACAMAFAHGSNDVANAVGPVAAVVSVVTSGGEVTATADLNVWILLLGGVGIVIGLVTYGQRVIRTVGQGITSLSPSRGFAATIAAATTVVLASGTGLPISTTHTLVGGVLGVGVARGIAALNLRMVGQIFISWIVTLPAGAVLAVLFFYILEALLG
ncbi:inorganic phosphate transporter [Arhodomonas sp. SL1]|uniref:inorganic phosphate transporter n=1 Tax=Arhodomonas sp. SL1 TaxID=3425691 RepID=UPI003F883EF5